MLPPTEDVDTWLKFSSLCRKSGRISQARSTLIKLLQVSHIGLRFCFKLFHLAYHPLLDMFSSLLVSTILNYVLVTYGTMGLHK